MSLAQQLMDLVASSQGPLGLTILGFCAFIEYVFPPFPGDLVTVFGAFLVTRRGWPAAGVLGAVLVGSAVGCMVGYFTGRLLARTEGRWAAGRLARFRPKIDELVERFARHGTWYIAINRFLPSVRALFFVAAGMARLPPWKVLGLGMLSAILWTAALFTIGATVGSQWAQVERIFIVYGQIAWGLLALIVLFLLARWWWKRPRASVR